VSEAKPLACRNGSLLGSKPWRRREWIWQRWGNLPWGETHQRQEGTPCWWSTAAWQRGNPL